MAIFLASFAVFLLAIVGMAAGVLAGRPAIKGSCGGLNRSADGLPGCDVCAEPCPARRRANARARQQLGKNVEAA